MLNDVGSGRVVTIGRGCVRYCALVGKGEFLSITQSSDSSYLNVSHGYATSRV